MTRSRGSVIECNGNVLLCYLKIAFTVSAGRNTALAGSIVRAMLVLNPLDLES